MTLLPYATLQSANNLQVYKNVLCASGIAVSKSPMELRGRYFHFSPHTMTALTPPKQWFKYSSCCVSSISTIFPVPEEAVTFMRACDSGIITSVPAGVEGIFRDSPVWRLTPGLLAMYASMGDFRVEKQFASTSIGMRFQIFINNFGALQSIVSAAVASPFNVTLILG